VASAGDAEPAKRDFFTPTSSLKYLYHVLYWIFTRRPLYYFSSDCTPPKMNRIARNFGFTLQGRRDGVGVFVRDESNWFCHHGGVEDKIGVVINPARKGSNLGAYNLRIL